MASHGVPDVSVGPSSPVSAPPALVRPPLTAQASTSSAELAEASDHPTDRFVLCSTEVACLDPHRECDEEEVRRTSSEFSLPIEVLTDCVDFSTDRVEIRRGLDGEALKGYLARERQGWSKVRWINLNGGSWATLRLLGLKYNLHPLALEDALHHSSSRSKVDYYRQHLFCKAFVHELVPHAPDAYDPIDDGSESTRALLKGRTGSKKRKQDLEQSGTRTGDDLDVSRKSLDREEGIASVDDAKTMFSGTTGHKAMKASIDEMTKAYKVQLTVQPLSIFLLRDNTIITVVKEGDRILAPLFDRLQQEDGVLRSSEDASMVLQGLLDVVVDNLLEISEAFRRQLTLLEARVLVQPEMDAVRHLHILAAELLLLKRTLTPIQSERSSLVAHPSTPQQQHTPMMVPPMHSPQGHHSPNFAPPPGRLAQSPSFANGPGYISPQTRIYLGDVLDHDGVLSSLELFSALATNLVDFSFNTLAFSQNESVRGLSIITVIFLPLTFLSGYFGMNFADFPPILGSVEYFWAICIPVVVGVTTLFGWGYFMSLYRTGKRKAAHWKRMKTFRSRRRGMGTKAL